VSPDTVLRDWVARAWLLKELRGEGLLATVLYAQAPRPIVTSQGAFTLIDFPMPPVPRCGKSTREAKWLACIRGQLKRRSQP
jgi:hypothetical protein